MSIESLPKAELHVHLEGTAYPELVRKIAAKKNITLPSDLFTPKGDYNWSDFVEFLQRYDEAAAIFTTRSDYKALTYDYLRRIAAENAIYAELIVSPDHATANGLAIEDQMAGIEEAIKEAEKDFGITTRIVCTIVRHYGVEKSLKCTNDVIDYIKTHPDNFITGFHMSGDENFGKVKDFKPCFDLAKKAGLKTACHAGEAAGPQSVWDAINDLKVDRIGHGVRSIEDKNLVAELAKNKIPLEVCLHSNISTGVYKTPKDHPLRKLYDAGCVITLSSDDPPYFATSIGREYKTAAETFNFTEEELLNITTNSIKAAFIDEKTRTKLLEKLNSFKKDNSSVKVTL